MALASGKQLFPMGSVLRPSDQRGYGTHDSLKAQLGIYATTL